MFSYFAHRFLVSTSGHGSTLLFFAIKNPQIWSIRLWCRISKTLANQSCTSHNNRASAKFYLPILFLKIFLFFFYTYRKCMQWYSCNIKIKQMSLGRNARRQFSRFLASRSQIIANPPTEERAIANDFLSFHTALDIEKHSMTDNLIDFSHSSGAIWHAKGDPALRDRDSEKIHRVRPVCRAFDRWLELRVESTGRLQVHATRTCRSSGSFSFSFSRVSLRRGFFLSCISARPLFLLWPPSLRAAYWNLRN